MKLAFKKSYLMGIVTIMLSSFLISSTASASLTEKVLVNQENFERGTYESTKVAMALGTVANQVNSSSYSNMVDINGDFERDSNHNQLPDFWEVVWRNGESSNSYAVLAPYEPVQGKLHYRLYNGDDDAQSYQYVLSDQIPVTGGSAYTIKAFLRYTLPVGRAEMSIIQGDAQGNNNGEIHYTYNNGGWKWNEKNNSFVLNPDTKFIRIRFGVGGEVGAYLDVDKVELTQLDINEGYEKDENSNNLPDFWETVWRNGTSTNPFATIAPYEPIDGKYHYRLFNGLDDKESFMYALSDSIPVLGGSAYELSTYLRYALPLGRVEMSIIQADAQGNNVGEIHNVYGNGAWNWKAHYTRFVVQPNVASIRIRFGVGGEVGAYLDIDHTKLHLLNSEGNLSFIRYEYNQSNEVKRIIYPNGKIVEIEYDANGNQVRRKIVKE
ncbi:MULTISPECIES: hypothetical protein [unclassified Paenibacillus]|uniref:hypothetical protein n=1 Tax=unclassified Paenibacillus TaxID=185978 RepID=UPI00048C45CF|nr:MULTISPECIES: hypothetical protein [unclassified Paenibacillus]SDE38703.1 hypothetical protein SAMN04488689_101305 [Paenibacillus sp. cl6col]